MNSPEFQAALPFVLRWEGGFVDHPNDPGGATNKGVTQAVYDGWRAQQGLATRSVRLLASEEMHAIYDGAYWRAAFCPKLMQPLDLAQFDTAVNMGVGRAVRFLQKAVAAEIDGAFGPATERCVASCDAGQALANYCQIREALYRQLVVKNPKLGVFLKGWMNRLNALRKELGLPGFEAVGDEVDFGEPGYIARVPDIGQDPLYD